jgi:hypothetical protein
VSVVSASAYSASAFFDRGGVLVMARIADFRLLGGGAA